MHTSSPVFQEAFVKHCYDQGLSAEATAELFLYAHIEDLRKHYPSFAEGFDETVKTASVFMDPRITTEGRTAPMSLGAAAGAGLGLLGGRFKALGNIGAGARALVGGTLGMGAGEVATKRPVTTDLKSPYTPSYMQPALAPGAKPGVGVPAIGATSNPAGKNIFSTPTALDGVAAPTAKTPTSSMHGVLQSGHAQVQALDKAILDAQTRSQAALAKPGLEGSLENRRIQAQLVQLQQQRQQALMSSNSTMGAMYGDQKRSLGDIDRALSDTRQKVTDLSPAAEKMDAHFRNNPTPGWLGRTFNSITGAEGQAETLQSQLARLRAHEMQLQKQREQIGKMMVPTNTVL